MVAVVNAMATAGGVAMAADQIDCPNRDAGRRIGTGQPDEMIGSRFDITIRGRGGSDEVRGGWLRLEIGCDFV